MLETNELVSAVGGLAEHIASWEVGPITRGLAEEVDIVVKAVSGAGSLLGQTPELQELARVIRGYALCGDQTRVILGETASRNAALSDQVGGLETTKGDIGSLGRLGLVLQKGAGARGEGKVLDASGLATLLNVEHLEAGGVAETLEGSVDFAAGTRDHLELADKAWLTIALEDGYVTFSDGIGEIIGVEHTRKDGGRGSADGEQGREGSSEETHRG